MAIPVAEMLFAVQGGEVRLLAARHRATGRLMFPVPEGTSAAEVDVVPLPSVGTLWSWTVQRFRPKPPYDGDDAEAFRPYGVAYVQLGDLLIVEGRIAGALPDTLRIGQPMRTVTEDYARAADGTPIATYAFAPIEAAA